MKKKFLAVALSLFVCLSVRAGDVGMPGDAPPANPPASTTQSTSLNPLVELLLSLLTVMP
jgi:hypothetical protein